MIDPSEVVLRALMHLEGSPDFEVVVAWIKESRLHQLAENTEILEETRLRWGQGRAQELSDLLTTLANVRTLYAVKKK